MKKALIFGMLIGLAIICMAALRVQAKSLLSPAEEATYADTRLLLQASAEALGPAASVQLTLKKSGPSAPAADDAELLELGRSWSERLGMEPAASLTDQQGHAVYRQQAETQGCVQTLLLTALSVDSTYLIVRTECEAFPVQDTERAVSLQQRVDAGGQTAGWGGAWNVIVQGGLQERTEDGALAALEKTLHRLDAGEVERYEDRGTISRSYRSGRLNGYVLSGTEKLHVQAALRCDSTDGDWRLTIGAPVVTTEY